LQPYRNILKATVLIFAAFFCSCKNSEKKNVPEATTVAVATPTPTVPDSFQTGLIIPSVSLQQYPAETFALYLPAGFSRNKEFAAIIFFDPHGNGTLPLKNYSALAEKYGFVLLGSNNSKNGLGFDETSNYANHLITEAQNRFSCAAGKLALCGFSGGAKVALVTAAQNSAVSKVIYCGAAMPVQPTHQLSMLGFAGIKDMNYTDAVAFNRQLAGTAIPHFLIEWKGKHEFPSTQVFEDAFRWLTTGKIPKYEDKAATISPAKVEQEQQLKQQYLQAFETKNLDWWKSEIVQLNSKKKTDAMYERLLGFISLACYSITKNSLQQNNLAVAEKIIAIYRLADPGNADCEQYAAQFKQIQNTH
jgi:dienelactone hydrolase